jgi:hypothetical protein
MNKWYKDVRWIVGAIIALIGVLTPIIMHFTSTPPEPARPIEIHQTIQGGAPGSTVSKTININR